MMGQALFAYHWGAQAIAFIGIDGRPTLIPTVALRDMGFIANDVDMRASLPRADPSPLTHPQQAAQAFRAAQRRH
jgi:hypothetical protein